MKRLMTNILNLAGVIVEDEKHTTETLILTVKSSKKTAKCPRCGQLSHRLHQNQGYLVRDLPICNREVILRVNRRRFKCINCLKPFSETLDFVGEKKIFTHRYAETITEQVIHSDISNVVLVDLDTHKLIGLVAERKQSEIEKVMLKWGEKVLAQIKEVSMDMTGNYKSLVKKLCPNADVTVYRFHVTKMLHEELNQARIDQKKVAEALNIKERTKIFDGLKGSKYILLKAEDNLSDKQKEKLNQVKEASPLVGIMHSLKEEFHFLFEHSQNLGEGTLKLIDWLKKAQPYYKKSVATIKRWLAEIVGYFEQRTTNGIVEGINNKLKLLKRCAFGFRNFINFEVRALLSWHFPKNLAQ